MRSSLATEAISHAVDTGTVRSECASSEGEENSGYGCVPYTYNATRAGRGSAPRRRPPCETDRDVLTRTTRFPSDHDFARLETRSFQDPSSIPSCPPQLHPRYRDIAYEIACAPSRHSTYSLRPPDVDLTSAHVGRTAPVRERRHKALIEARAHRKQMHMHGWRALLPNARRTATSPA